MQGERLQATEKHTPPLLTPPECGKLDHRQRCRLCCCLAPRWRRSLLTAFGANCQGISVEKSCLQVFSRPLTIGKVAIRRSSDQGSTKPTEPAQRPRRTRSGAVGGGRKRRQRRGTKAKGGRTQTQGATKSARTPDKHPAAPPAETSQNFLLCERLSRLPELRIIKILRQFLSATSFAGGVKPAQTGARTERSPSGEHASRPQPDEKRAAKEERQPRQVGRARAASPYERRA